MRIYLGPKQGYHRSITKK